jgi:hypothetical protein
VSPQTTKVIIAGVLLLHGLGHVGALAAIAVNWSDRGTTTGAWLPARSWLIPSLAPQTAKIVASTFWVLATIGFVAAALSFLGIVVPGAMWRQVALASSVVSLLGITLSFGTWPAFNIIAALGVNVAILVTQVWLHWPPLALFGK